MNDLDDLMSRIEVINAMNPNDLTGKHIDDIIAYHRRQRARKAQGFKPEQAGGSDISAIVAKLVQPQPKPEPMKRRI